MSKPIELMHVYFGENKNTCGTCCNLVEVIRGKKKLRNAKPMEVSTAAKLIGPKSGWLVGCMVNTCRNRWYRIRRSKFFIE